MAVAAAAPVATAEDLEPAWGQAELERKRSEEEEKELIIRRQQQTIEEQNRKIALLQQMQQLSQQPQSQLHAQSSAPTSKGPLDDVLEDLQQLIESESRALPDAILADLENLSVGGARSQQGATSRSLATPRMTNFAATAGSTVSAASGAAKRSNTVTPASGTYAFRSGSAIIPGSGVNNSIRNNSTVAPAGTYAFRSGSAIKPNPASSNYAGTVSAAAAPALIPRTGTTTIGIAAAITPRSAGGAMSSPRHSIGKLLPSTVH